MNSRILVAFLAAAALSLTGSGCVIYGGGGGGGAGGGGGRLNPGDATFTWTLAGGSCSDFPNVNKVIISIPGESLQNGGVFGCLNDDTNHVPTAGIRFTNFAGGS